MTDKTPTLEVTEVLELDAKAVLGTTPETDIDMKAAATQLWKKIGTFPGIGTWHPAVVSCDVAETDGLKRRTLTLPDGAQIVEQEESRDDALREYVYSIVESPLPIANYRSQFAIRIASTTTLEVTWSGTFVARGASDADAIAAIQGVYRGGMAGIRELVGKL